MLHRSFALLSVLLCAFGCARKSPVAFPSIPNANIYQLDQVELAASSIDPICPGGHYITRYGCLWIGRPANLGVFSRLYLPGNDLYHIYNRSLFNYEILHNGKPFAIIFPGRVLTVPRPNGNYQARSLIPNSQGEVVDLKFQWAPLERGWYVDLK